MCLKLKKHYEAIKADEPVTCYKVLTGNVTPYANVGVPDDALAGKSDFCAEYLEGVHVSVVRRRYDGNYEINSGMIHTFASYRAAVDDSRWLKGRGCENVAIWECVIPAGYYYYEGTTQICKVNENDIFMGVYHGKSYASPRIRFIKKIKDFSCV